MEDLSCEIAVLEEVVVSQLKDFKKEKMDLIKKIELLEQRVLKLEQTSSQKRKRSELDDDDESDVESILEELQNEASTSLKETRYLAKSVNDLPTSLRGKVTPYLSSVGSAGEKMPTIQLAFYKYWISAQEEEVTGMCYIIIIKFSNIIGMFIRHDNFEVNLVTTIPQRFTRSSNFVVTSRC